MCISLPLNNSQHFRPKKAWGRVGLLVTLLLLTGCASLNSSVPTACSPGSLQMKLQRAASDDVATVELIYIPEDLETEYALAAEDVEKKFWGKLVIRHFQESEFRPLLLMALRSSGPAVHNGPRADLRWACIFYGLRGERMVSVYGGLFGRGQVDDIPVLTDPEPLRKLFLKKFESIGRW